MNEFDIKLVDREEGCLLIIDNVFSEEEYREISDDVEILLENTELSSAEDMLTAKLDGKFFSKRKGLKLDLIFKFDRNNFAYFKHYLKPISKILSQLDSLPYAFRWLENTNKDTSILGVYGNADEYDLHIDSSVFTVVFFIQDNKKFEGGDLFFETPDVRVTHKRNRLVIFPSWMKHGVTKVTYPDNYQPKITEHRLSITTLFTMEFERDE